MRLETEAGQQSLKIMQLLTPPAVALRQKLPVIGGRDILPLTGLRFVAAFQSCWRMGCRLSCQLKKH
jgi:hypothetical protein